MNIHSSIIHNNGGTFKKWKQHKCLSTNEWINKMQYIDTMEYHTAIKGNEVLIHSTMWMNLKKHDGK